MYSIRCFVGKSFGFGSSYMNSRLQSVGNQRKYSKECLPKISLDTFLLLLEQDSEKALYS